MAHITSAGRVIPIRSSRQRLANAIIIITSIYGAAAVRALVNRGGAVIHKGSHCFPFLIGRYVPALRTDASMGVVEVCGLIVSHSRGVVVKASEFLHILLFRIGVTIRRHTAGGFIVVRRVVGMSAIPISQSHCSVRGGGAAHILLGPALVANLHSGVLIALVVGHAVNTAGKSRVL